MDAGTTYRTPPWRKVPLLLPKLRKVARTANNNLLDDLLKGTLDAFVAGLSEQVAVVDERWIILSVNDAWKQMVRIAGYPELVPGTDYRGFLRTFASKGHKNAAAVLSGLRAIDAGKTDSFELTYAGVDEWEGRTLQLRIHRLHFQARVITTITRQDITDSVELGRVRKDCTAAILKSEAEARRRLTRELHDSTAQLLVSIGLLLPMLKNKATADGVEVVEEIQDLLAQAMRDIRSMSYLAHAPDVIEIGIVQALEVLAAGYGRRTQLDVHFQVLGTRARLPKAIKIALYRIAQEALSNVYRHARATRVRMSLVFRKSVVHLVIADNGVGVSHHMLAGAETKGGGLNGIRSRLAEIEGRLSVRCLSPGMAIVATVPRTSCRAKRIAQCSV